MHTNPLHGTHTYYWYFTFISLNQDDCFLSYRGKRFVLFTCKWSHINAEVIDYVILKSHPHGMDKLHSYAFTQSPPPPPQAPTTPHLFQNTKSQYIGRIINIVIISFRMFTRPSPPASVFTAGYNTSPRPPTEKSSTGCARQYSCAGYKRASRLWRMPRFYT